MYCIVSDFAYDISQAEENTCMVGVQTCTDTHIHGCPVSG